MFNPHHTSKQSHNRGDGYSSNKFHKKRKKKCRKKNRKNEYCYNCNSSIEECECFNFKHPKRKYCNKCKHYKDRCSCTNSNSSSNCSDHSNCNRKRYNSDSSSNDYIQYKQQTCRKPWPPSTDQPEGEHREFRNIDAFDVKTKTLSAGPKTIFVPSATAANLGEALCSLDSSNEPLGYRIILKNGSHSLATSINNDVTNVRIEAESFTPHMGMYYGHETGQHEFARLFNTEYESCVGGLGPFILKLLENGSAICVEGELQNPNYDTLEFGDVIRFYHRTCSSDISDDFFTDHCICKGNKNLITLQDPICKTNNEVLPGEGFFVL